jgi:FkbM family methyltransferase
MVQDLYRLFSSTPRPDPQAWMADGRPLYIYGAGNIGRQLSRILHQRGAHVAAFLDRKAAPGAQWDDLLILRPDDASLSPAQRAQARVLIGIFNRDTETPAIVESLHQLGYTTVIDYLDVHAAFPKELGDHFWLTGRDYYLPLEQTLTETEALWADDESRALFHAILRCRLLGDYTCLPQPNRDDQYFPTGLPGWPEPIRLIDCGAYDGDTLRHLARLPLRLAAVAAFEPDLANFSKLAQTAQGLASSTSICLYPCGVSDKTQQLRFQTGQGEGSHTTSDGDTVISCVALDEALPGFRPSLIKMDIEGAEYDALLGARGLIEQSRPGLAISVYHRADHLWTIPLQVQAWLKGGKHYLRLHAYTGLELIYYWIP